ncbi:prophage tail fiber N-terminal domain-containing protein [Escherichia coli]|uniref:prophage tail fiber N-terminal domain-containing protein n=1 Tax=Escherichia coli TaxID=562 RepID=UPI0024AE083A|nr:prophage tail fiber N-terminal domain-containing protein [Escherichia coli]MDM4973920.1 prophage tail fiber N-terminal domain-containing protein [Escherichia coli]MDM4990673.1 prophage tail fiber N-terminal domain-containing protein [Escherichia coli]MDM5161891.1 prophage tail fiber N-terminal domain-containing protein [Escherichia coli]WHG76353.1 prophage tail fiber N-terminal domain-containing protein [Escherichia coli]
MAVISGVYANGIGGPVVGVQLVLTARVTSSGVVMTTVVEQKTGAAGEYKFDMKPGVYVVTGCGAYLGVINVNPDSPDGTLNNYLTNFSADEMTPAALTEIQELVNEAKAAAATAQDAAAQAITAVEKIGTPAPYIPPAWDAPGSTIFGYLYIDKGTSYLRPGEIVSASSIYVGNVTMIDKGSGPMIGMSHTQQPSGGSWRLQGSTTPNTDASVKSMRSALIFLRIDSDSLLTPSLLKSGRGSARVRNCRYVNAEGTSIDCEIFTANRWIPFTAAADDVTDWGRKIFSDALAGLYGVIGVFGAPLFPANCSESPVV